VSRIDFLGHATALIELDSTRILTDPLLRTRISGLVHRHPPVLDQLPPHLDAVLISHLHHDHLDLPSLKLLGAQTHILTPRYGQALLRRAGFGNTQEVGPGDSIEVNGLRLLTTRAVHLGLRAPLGPWGGCVGYVIEAEHRVYFAGDTQAFSAMRILGPIDIALMPIAGWGPVLGPGHMGPAAAVEALQLIRPRVVIPIHWGSLVPFGLHRRAWSYLTQPPLDFVERMRLELPEVRVEVLQPGESFTF
jgi:L-ascorbate metabolism protein UlaG (beta-lactamase superfamily)